MTPPTPPKNLAASINARLLNLARARKEDAQFVVTQYGIERFLYRLSTSPHASSFVLKGASLFTVWSGHPHRATKDIDLLGKGAPDLDRLGRVFRDVCSVPAEDDGLFFDPSTVTTERIKEGANYEGVRVLLRATLGTARLAMQVDVGFGDAVTPAAVPADFPTLLGHPAPRIHIYPRETVVAEKLQAMVDLGLFNSRMKDFYDLWFLARGFEFEGHVLAQALEATFARRRTPLPSEPPFALTPAFAADGQKQVQWRAFLSRSRVVETALALAAVIEQLWAFLEPPLLAAREGTAFSATWSDGVWQGYERPVSKGD